jgi:cytochrome c
MIGGQLRRRACVLALLAAIPNLVEAGPNAPQTPAERVSILVASSEKGSEVFQGRCSMCHAIKEGEPNKSEPTLHGLFGRQAASVPGYEYSSDMKSSHIVWNAQTLDAYLADPHRGIPDAGMPYLGLSSKTDRDDLIAYLEQATR